MWSQRVRNIRRNLKILLLQHQPPRNCLIPTSFNLPPSPTRAVQVHLRRAPWWTTALQEEKRTYCTEALDPHPFLTSPAARRPLLFEPNSIFQCVPTFVQSATEPSSGSRGEKRWAFGSGLIPFHSNSLICYYVSHGMAEASWYQMELRFNHFHPILHPVQCKEYIAAYQSFSLSRLVLGGEKVQIRAGVRQFRYRYASISCIYFTVSL